MADPDLQTQRIPDLMKIGFGFDAHELIENRPLKLGGVRIEHSLGLRGHSDGDVVLHALCDAFLGACAEGDIGTHFNDEASETENMNSKEILKFAIDVVEKSRLKVANIDLVIVADNPKLSPHYQEIP